MAGYTRQSTASIINGSSITAPPINAEFNQLLAAFNATTGHGHTGATGDAPKIPLTTSVSGYLPLVHGGVGGRNNVTNSVPTANDDSGDGYAPGSIWENSTTGRVYICVGNSSGAAVWRELVQVDSGNAIIPASNNTVDLGNNSTRFQDLFLSGGIAAAGNVAIGGTLTTTGTSAFTGLATFANLSATGTTTITSVDLNSGAIDNAVIGSATPAAGTFTTLNANTSLVAATADINGGTIDGAALGATTPSTGSFTTLGASGTSTLATVDINGGNIDGTVIGASTTAAGSFTTLSTSGQATLATADINGGSIDGSTIGANSASTGAFTTLSSSGGITGSLTGNVTGNTAGVHTGAVTGNVTGNLTGNVTAGSGTSTFTNLVVNGNLNMNAGTSATITNLTAPSSDLDAATKKYVDDEISTLIGDAGTGLDTLGELADALNDDDAFSTTVTNSIATKLPKAGGTMTGAIAMSTNKITGAGDPTSAQDVSTKVYTDTQRDTRVAKTGDTMSGALAMGNNKITGLATPTAGTDVTNKTYVDGILGSATVAATSATNAATSETNAATSATNAATSETNAATSATNAASSYDSFDDRYLGAKSSAPTVDNDGDALITGALYFNSTTNIMNVYGSGGWQSAGSAVNGTSERNTYTATAGQTVFAATYDTGYIDVYLNGVKLLAGTDFTATNGTSITLASGASVNDVVDIVAYGTFVLADHYTRTASDARYVEVAGDTMTGNLNINGTVTADGLDLGATTDAATVSTTASDYQLQLGAAQSATGDIGRNISFDVGGTTTAAINTIDGGTGNTNALAFFTSTTGNLQKRLLLEDNGDISFYEDTGTTAKFFWDASAESLGIGTSSPSATIDVVSSGTNSQSLAEFSSASGLRAKIASDGGDDGYMYLYDANDANTVSFRTDGNHSFINGGGNFGIGTSSPSSLLELSNTTPPVITLDSTTTTGQRGLGFQYNGTTFGQIGQDIQTGELRIRSGETGQSGYFIKFDTGGTERMRIDTSGRVGIGTSSPSQKLVVDGNIQLGTSSGAGILYLSSSSGFSPRLQEDSNALSIYTNNSERMRIDASGNVLVGHTSADVDTLVDNNTVGITLKANGEILASSTATVATLERENSDGDLIEFRKDGSTVGSIFSSGGIQMGIGDGDTGLLFGDNIDAIMPWSTSNTQRDNATDLGRSATRFKDLYLSGGVYLGGAVAANKLDDYEEGTWTPVLGGSTTTSGQSYHTQHGSYTKIGRVVHLQAYVVVSSIGTTSGSYGQVQNLPFPAAPVQGYGGGVFQFFNLLGTNVSQLTAYAEGNTSFAYVLYTAGAGTTTSYLGGGGWGSAPQIMLSMTYLTNS